MLPLVFSSACICVCDTIRRKSPITQRLYWKLTRFRPHTHTRTHTQTHTKRNPQPPVGVSLSLLCLFTLGSMTVSWSKPLYKESDSSKLKPLVKGLSWQRREVCVCLSVCVCGEGRRNCLIARLIVWLNVPSDPVCQPWRLNDKPPEP